MNRAGHQLLARSTLSQNQYWIGVLRNFFDQAVNALHFGRSTNQAAETWAGSQLFAEDSVFLIRLEKTHETIQLAAKIGNVERLGDVVGGPHARSLHRAFNRAVLRENDHGSLRIELADALEKFQTSQLRDAQIGEYDVHRILVEYFERLLSGGSHPGTQAGIDHDLATKIPRGIFIVHDQDGYCDGVLCFTSDFCVTSQDCLLKCGCFDSSSLHGEVQFRNCRYPTQSKSHS